MTNYQLIFFDTSPGSRRQFFSKNITSIDGYLSIDPSTKKFKLKSLNLFYFNEIVYFRLKFKKKGGLKLKLYHELK